MSEKILGLNINGPIWFWLGTIGVTIGVLLHIPMLQMAWPHLVMVGMPMDVPMYFGMAAIIAGTIAVAHGLRPQAIKVMPLPVMAGDVKAAEKLTVAHWKLIAVLVVAVVIDTMKPATLGFVMPGTLKEYGLSKPEGAWLPLIALLGTVTGSLMWGWLADIMGRRASILLAAVMFIGTSICGAMPSFAWNLIMCYIMGLSAGGLLPIAYTLLAETMPDKQRGWLLVLVGGVGTVGGYFAASGLATWLEPVHGWRILWLLGMPTGLMLVLLNHLIPESPRFLWLHGRPDAARAVMSRFGIDPARLTKAPDKRATNFADLFRGQLIRPSLMLGTLALAWGLVNFGLLLWLPNELRQQGFDPKVTDGLLFKSTVLALPLSVIAAVLYQRFSTRWTLLMLGLLMLAGLVCLGLLPHVDATSILPMLAIGLLLAGLNGVIAVLLPYAAESYPLALRGRGTGLIAGASKAGGLAAQIVVMSGVVPGLIATTFILAGPLVLGLLLLLAWGRETRDVPLDLAVDDLLGVETGHTTAST